MAAKTNKTEALQSTLPHWWGISPFVYVPVLTLAVLLFVFVGVFIYPGLRHYGAQVHFASTPSGAAVYVDDTLVGHTPVRVFIPAGAHNIRWTRPYFATATQDVRVRGRVFASLIFPKRAAYQAQLSMQNIQGFLKDAYFQASAWLAFTPSRIHPQPPILEETAQVLCTLSTQQDTSLITQWAASLGDLVYNDASWQHVQAAWNILDKHSILVPPESKASSLQDFLQAHLKQISASLHQSSIVFPKIFVAGLPFIAASGGRFLLATPEGALEYPTSPTHMHVAPFYYMPTPVTAGDFSRLTGQNIAQASHQPVVNVSIAQADALVLAVNQSLKSNGMHLKARLPNEVEWQYLAQTERIAAHLFEWTDDNYVPYRFILHANQAQFAQPFRTRERAIRGESPFSGSLPVWHRFGFLQDCTSPYITFRLVLEQTQ